MKKQLLAILFLSFSITVFAQQINIIPKPIDTKITPGNFAISTATIIIYGDEGEKNTANFLNSSDSINSKLYNKLSNFHFFDINYP